MIPADLDALVARLHKDAVTHKQLGWDGDAEWDLLLAATLTRLRDENKERAEIIENHRAARKSAEAELADSRSHDAERQEEWFEAQKRAERAEAEVERLKDALRQANGVRDVFASAVVAQAMQDPARSKPCDCVRPEIHGHQLLCKQGNAR